MRNLAMLQFIYILLYVFLRLIVGGRGENERGGGGGGGGGGRVEIPNSEKKNFKLIQLL